jgi:hypothetical protein
MMMLVRSLQTLHDNIRLLCWIEVVMGQAIVVVGFPRNVKVIYVFLYRITYIQTLMTDDVYRRYL